MKDGEFDCCKRAAFIRAHVIHEHDAKDEEALLGNADWLTDDCYCCVIGPKDCMELPGVGA